MRKVYWGILVFVAACAKRDGATPPTLQPTNSSTPPVVAPIAGQGGAESQAPPDGLSEPSEALRIVTPSPAAPRELPLPAGQSVTDLAVASTGPVAFVLTRGADGRARILSWSAGAGQAATIATLPEGFTGRSISVHPVRGTVFVAGGTTDTSRILRLSPSASGWTAETIYTTPRQIDRLLMSTRPFFGDNGSRYRLFFAAKSTDGSTSIRTITEAGRLEYQVAGPEATIDHYTDMDGAGVPARVTTPYAFPLAVHPMGDRLLWKDQRGCPHQVGYGSFDGWTGDAPVAGAGCEGELRITPNGRDYLLWKNGSPGVTLIRAEGRRGGGAQATGYTFSAAPTSTPDGKGVIGTVARGGGTTLVFAPVSFPLADVANASTQAGSECDEALFVRNAGFFRPRPSTEQLYNTYESMHYDGGGDPALATTDLFWENFGTAYNGVFVVIERYRAVPAFWAFVSAADSALRGTSGTWPKAFAAVAAYHRGDTATGEAALIARGTGPAPSSVLDSTFDFAELMPRGHYTSEPGMREYFRGVHYLTQINQVRDPAVLARLPARVQQLAQRWIDGYRPFIAPSRAPLVWTTGAQSANAPYTRHPWKWSAIFPLSWGADNEALEDGVQHDKWPLNEWIVGPGPTARQHPSGLDVGVVYGSALARTLLADTIRFYPSLGPTLDGIRAHRLAPSAQSSLYDRWLDAVAMEWADSTAFPGTSPGRSLWDVKRLQTGLASWATLREATILVTERAGAAEMGESGFEEVIYERPRGYVEPAPRTFDAIAGLYDALRTAVLASGDLDIHGDSASDWQGSTLREAVAARLSESAVEARDFAAMARTELRGEALSDSQYDRIQGVGGAAEHQFLIYKSLQNQDLAISIPDPMAKIADVAGSPERGILEVAVGGPLEWHQIAPFFGRRQIVVGSVYSYYEFTSKDLYDNKRWRAAVDQRARPQWVQDYIAPSDDACRASPAR